LLACASHRTVLPGHAYGSLDRCVSLTAGAALTPSCCPPGDGSCRGSALRYMRHEGAHAGYVRCARLPAPLRAVGEREAQLTVTRSSQSISPFAPPAFAGFNATMRRSDFCMGVGWSSLPPSSLPLAGCPIADPGRPPRVRTLDVLPLPSPLPCRPRLDFGRRVRRHAHPAGPACPGIHLRSVLQCPYGFFPTRPRGHAVAFGSWLLPTRSTEDLHLLSSAHAWHTKWARAEKRDPRARGGVRRREMAAVACIVRIPMMADSDSDRSRTAFRSMADRIPTHRGQRSDDRGQLLLSTASLAYWNKH
jgi:hypothetical protein